MNYKKIDELISESLKYTDLEIRQSELGLVYRPNHEESDKNGYLRIKNIEDYPEFNREIVSPKVGVGHIDPLTGDRLRHVEFLQYDEEEIFGKKMPENGYKYSKIIVEPQPMGLNNITHEFGVKGKSTDFRFTRPIIPQRDQYIFMYLFDENDQEGGYYVRINPKAKNNTVMKELAQLYNKRLEKSLHVKVTLNGFLKNFRLKILPSYWIEKSKIGTIISYSFHPSIDFKINGASSLSDIEKFLLRTKDFLIDCIRYIQSMLIIRKISLNEYEIILNELKNTQEIFSEAEKTLHNSISNYGRDASFNINEHDWFIDTNDDIHEKVSLYQMKKPPGPIQTLKNKLSRMLTPRQEQFSDIKNSNFDDGFLFIDTENKTKVRNIGEIIRSQYLYSGIGKQEIEIDIDNYIFDKAKEKRDQ
ncbi:hypothetical protein [Mesobacillus maritimus]|uniref:hypothetical protein n=1 Tax=Mesobacillus maritimus TaxID=1643336 RepID=UPI00384DA2D3